MTTRSHRNRRIAIIPFDPDPPSFEIQYIKHKRSTRINGILDEDKVRVPVLHTEAEPVHILDFLIQFETARLNLQWTTGPKLFQKFPMHLTRQDRLLWDDLLLNRPRTVAGFDEVLLDFKDEILEGYDYHDQLDYLRTLQYATKNVIMN